MKKGCLLWWMQLAILTGLYYLALRGRVPPPSDGFAALGGGAGLLLAIGAFRNVRSARKSRALLDHAHAGAPFEDGQRIAAVGPILALGAPIHAPFSETPCVFCSWEISHQSPSRARGSRADGVKDFGGFTLTRCVVQTPTGNVRILGFPVLDGFPEEAQRGDAAFARARAYVQSAAFEPMGVTKVFSQLKDLLGDEDGYLRKDWRMAGGGFELDPKVHTLTEQVVRDGQTVCALGLYSAERNGLVPGYGQAGEGLKLIQGDSEPARQALTTRIRQSVFAGSLILLVSHFLLFAFLAARGSELRAEKNATREEAFFQAVKDGDLATVTAQLDAGLNPNLRDGYGNTPLMVVADPRVARRLISAGADVNARNEDSATPLIEAAKYCKLEVVRLLLQSGADVNARDQSEDRNALDWALVYDPQDKNYEEVARVLRDAGAEERSR